MCTSRHNRIHFNKLKVPVWRLPDHFSYIRISCVDIRVKVTAVIRGGDVSLSGRKWEYSRVQSRALQHRSAVHRTSALYVPGGVGE